MTGTIPSSLRYQSSSSHTFLPRCRSFKSNFLISLHEASCGLNRRGSQRLCFSKVGRYSSTSIFKRMSWSIMSSTDGNGLSSTPEDVTNGRTRLFRFIQTLQVELNMRVQKIRSRFFIKALFFLVGFYCATAFATGIGQTGEWDIFSAGLAVIVVEGIGALMYKGSFPLLSNIRSLVTMFNYWKVGLSLGLFLDAFKFEIDDAFGFSSPFNFEFDAFPLFL